MMEKKSFEENAGLFDRVLAMLEVIRKVPDKISDQEAEGLVALLPPDVANTIKAVLVPRIRDVSIHFLKMIGKWVAEAKKAADDGKKVILSPFNFPPELIHAFDNAHPLTSEVLSTLGVVALEGQGERYWDMAMGLGLPDYICSSNTIELGSMLGSSDFNPSAIISSAPGGCDINSKIHEFVARYIDIPIFHLAKHPDDSEKGISQYRKNTARLILQLEEFIGEKIDEKKLRSVLEKANRCTELYHELMALASAKPCPVPNIFTLFLYATRFTTWGTDDGIENLERMVNLAKQRLKNKEYPAKKEKARCVWAYTSFYFDFMNFYNWMEEKGYSQLGDGLDLFFPEPVETTSMDTMIDGIAHSAANMPMTRQVGAQEMSVSWTNDVIHASKSLNADCVIFCGHHSCKQTWSVVSILRQELEKQGLPLLVLQGDSWMRTMTPISVIQKEIEEFIENVVERKSKSKRKVRKRKIAPKTTPKKKVN